MTQTNGTTASFFDAVYADERVLKYYTSGEWKKSTSEKLVSIKNPATEDVAFHVQGNAFTGPSR